MLGECPNFQGGMGGKIRGMDKNKEFSCYACGNVGNSGPEFWQIPLVSIFRHSITILLHSKKYILKSKMSVNFSKLL